MSNLLIVLATSADDAPLAERLLDFIYHINGKQKRGHILLSMAADLHAEMETKIALSAELAFEGVTKFKAKPAMKGVAATKTENINDLFHQTGHFISTRYRWPWLWLEPDCVPLRPDWIEALATAYSSQPKKYVGRGMKRKVGEEEHPFIARTAIYPMGAWNELRLFNAATPFEWDAGKHIIARATKTKLIQQGRYENDSTAVSAEAVLFHSDKSGALMELIRERGSKELVEQNGESIPVNAGEISMEHFSKVLRDAETNPDMITIKADPEPPDKRTKAWKEWNARRGEVMARGS